MMRRKLAILVACTFCVGCQWPGQPRQLGHPPEGENTSAASTTGASDQPAGFSLSKMLQFAGFRSADQSQASLIPQEVLQLGHVVNTLVSRAGELNINDPPEVTKQKAQAILDSLRPWDSALAAGRSIGLVNDETARLLDEYVSRIKLEAQKLTQYMPSPQSIAAIQQLAAGLRTMIGPVVAMIGDQSQTQATTTP